MDITDKAYEKAKEILKQCTDPLGLKASALASGYPQVWARDSMITLLGAVLIDDKDSEMAIRNTFKTLMSGQAENGCIPANVIISNKKADFRAYIDGNCWFVIGQYIFFERFKDKEFLYSSWESIEKTLTWLSCQDVYNQNLIAMQEGADWMDNFSIRGRGLCINVLYYQALVMASKLACELEKKDLGDKFLEKSMQVKTQINKLFWVDDKKITLSDEYFADEELNIISAYKMTILHTMKYYLPFITFKNFGTWFDALGNLLAIIFNISDEEQTKKILDYINMVGVNEFPAKAIYPPVYPGESEWREYFKSHNLNLPHQYHNGGVWPFIGGFYISALIKAERFEEAEKELVKLAEVNHKGREGEWEFNEWMHGKTGEAMGMPFQAWSAGMYIYAYQCFKQKKLLFF